MFLSLLTRTCQIIESHWVNVQCYFPTCPPVMFQVFCLLDFPVLPCYRQIFSWFLIFGHLTFLCLLITAPLNCLPLLYLPLHTWLCFWVLTTDLSLFLRFCHQSLIQQLPLRCSFSILDFCFSPGFFFFSPLRVIHVCFTTGASGENSGIVVSAELLGTLTYLSLELLITLMQWHTKYMETLFKVAK